MKIECPHCQEINKIDQCDDIQCYSCHGSFKGFSFVKRTVISITTALAIGAGGGFGYTQLKKQDYLEHRYPRNIEYSIIDTCVSSSKINTQYLFLNEKRKLCICTLEKSQSDLPYDEYKKDITKIKRLMSENINNCL
ncbi:hypothetical protein KAH51_02040 [Proteus vulgaris]|uniref:hypothetical protein n=1 Tax=Proteus vulgaris TaxID=585 RepID=UPI001B3664C5|nr:hypothetical protein [Proteus vulgaris]MBQ0212236.1 hypothetical protein [Proteus vulgaris]